MDVSVSWPLCVLCVFVCVSTSKKTSCVRPQLHKSTLQRPCGTKVQGMCRSIILLSKITHQMWCNHSFGQRNKALKKAGIGVCAGMCECMLKRGWGKVGIIGALHKIGGLRTLSQLC